MVNTAIASSKVHIILISCKAPQTKALGTCAEDEGAAQLRCRLQKRNAAAQYLQPSLAHGCKISVSLAYPQVIVPVAVVKNVTPCSWQY
jgi:hypothetical protein